MALRKLTRALIYQSSKHRGRGYQGKTRKAIADTIRHQRKKLGAEKHRQLYNKGMYRI